VSETFVMALVVILGMAVFVVSVLASQEEDDQ
jgi:hypothetical protein